MLGCISEMCYFQSLFSILISFKCDLNIQHFPKYLMYENKLIMQLFYACDFGASLDM